MDAFTRTISAKGGRVMKLKNKIAILMICMVLCLSFASCVEDYNNADEEVKDYSSYFVQIKCWSDGSGDYYVVYAKDTKVKYLIWCDYRKGSITPLYNADGSLQVYEEGE
jgi:hypothetical protein